MSQGTLYQHKFVCTVSPWKYADGFRGGEQWRNGVRRCMETLCYRPIDPCYPLLSLYASDSEPKKITATYSNNREPCPSGSTTICIMKTEDNEFSAELSINCTNNNNNPSDELCDVIARSFCNMLFLVTEPISRAAIKYSVTATIKVNIFRTDLDILTLTKEKDFLWDFNGCYTQRNSPDMEAVLPY